MTGAAPEPAQEPPGISALTLSVTRARTHYQACRYAELITRLPRLLAQLDAACGSLDGDGKLRVYALSADAYHLAAGILLKTGDHGLAHLATDRSMTAALASQDPLTVGTSARIVTHTLASSGHLPAAIATAQNHSQRLDHETGTHTPESLSVYGSVLLRGALGRRNRHRPGRQINPAAVTVTERKASLLIDVAQAFFQWGKYSQAYTALRAAEQTAPQELAARTPVRTLARNLAALTPPGTRRDAAHLADRIGANT